MIRDREQIRDGTEVVSFWPIELRDVQTLDANFDGIIADLAPCPVRQPGPDTYRHWSIPPDFELDGDLLDAIDRNPTKSALEIMREKVDELRQMLD